MNRISQDEYLEALEKVNSFHIQKRADLMDLNIEAERLKVDINETILTLLRKHANKRIVNAISSFLASETAYRKIPFSSPEIVTVSFFARRYQLRELKKIWSLGTGGLKTLTKLLQEKGHTILP